VEPFSAGPKLQSLTFSQLEAICRFLPPDTIPNLQAAQNPENTKKTEGHSDRPLTDADISNRARDLQAHKWTARAAEAFLPIMGQAYRSMVEDNSAELNRLAAIYEAFPTELRTPKAPQTPRANALQIPLSFRLDAARVVVQPIRSPDRLVKPQFGKTTGEHYQFRRPHPVLIPYDWCFRLFNSVVGSHPVPQDGKPGGVYPEHLVPHLSQHSRASN
jgi:hypothetical protein